jgi:hypothetical protein
MSADNGIYVLVTKGPWVKAKNGRRVPTKEYRVTHAQAIENITWEPDYPDYMTADSVLNRDKVLKYFGTAPVFTSRTRALLAAADMYEEYDNGFYVEYGIQILNYLDVPFPKGVVPQRRRQHKRPPLTAVS